MEQESPFYKKYNFLFLYGHGHVSSRIALRIVKKKDGEKGELEQGFCKTLRDYIFC